MKEDFEHAVRYIEYLKNECHLKITLHDAGKGVISGNDELVPYNVHDNGYCLFAKRKREVWDRCIRNQDKIVCKLQKDGAFCGMCYLGVEEYVFPILALQEVVGFVSVGGYGVLREKAIERIRRAALEYGFDAEELLSHYDADLSHKIPDCRYVSTLVEPLCSMLALLYLKYGGKERRSFSFGNNYIYAHILSYITKNLSSKITIDDLCALCHCSRSHISHLFTQKTGMGLCEYVNRMRCDAAKQYLLTTEMRVSDIAYDVGFEDSNYFSTVFSKYVGLSPRAFRSSVK